MAAKKENRTFSLKERTFTRKSSTMMELDVPQQSPDSIHRSHAQPERAVDSSIGTVPWVFQQRGKFDAHKKGPLPCYLTALFITLGLWETLCFLCLILSQLE